MIACLSCTSLDALHINHTAEQFQKAQSIGAAASLVRMVLSIDRLYFERRIAQVQALQQRELAAAGEKNDDQSKDKQPTPEQLVQAAAKLNEQQSKQTNTPDGGNKIDAYQKQKELLQKKLLLTEGLLVE